MDPDEFSIIMKTPSDGAFDVLINTKDDRGMGGLQRASCDAATTSTSTLPSTVVVTDSDNFCDGDNPDDLTIDYGSNHINGGTYNRCNRYD